MPFAAIGTALGASAATATATGLAATGTAIAVGGAVASGVRASQSARFQEDVARQNARLSRERGTVEAARRRRVSARRLGGLQAREAPLDVIADAASELELDALLAEFEGELGARDFTIASEAQKAIGRAAVASGVIQGASSIFGGLGQLGILTRTTGPGIGSINSALDRVGPASFARTTGTDFTPGIVSFPTIAP